MFSILGCVCTFEQIHFTCHVALLKLQQICQSAKFWALKTKQIMCKLQVLDVQCRRDYDIPRDTCQHLGMMFRFN